MAWKVFLGVLGALFAFWLILSAAFGVFAWDVGKAADQQLHQVVEQQQHAERQLRERMHYDQVARERQRQYELARRRLGPEHRCLGGAVILVRGSTYTQLPAKCSGGYANVPLR